MTVLPVGWTRGTGLDAFTLVRGVSYTKSDARSEPGVGLIPILRANNIQEGHIVLSDFVYIPAKYVSPVQFLKPGDLLIATSSGSRDVVGKTAVAGPEHSLFAFGAFCSVARPKTKAVPEWMAYFTRSSQYRKYVEEVAVGIHINNFRTRDLEALPLPFAPLSEQRRIVAKLDSLFRRSKSACEHLASIPRLVERYRGALLASAFCGDLTEEWRLKGGTSAKAVWRQTTLGAVSADVRYGTSAKCHYEPKRTPVLRIPNVVNGRIDLSDLKYGSFSKEEEEKLALMSDDLLVIRSNGSLSLVGRVALVPKLVAGYLYAGYLIRLRLDSKQVYPPFVQYAFDEPSIRQHIERLAKSTSGVNNINSEQLKSITLKIPPLEEQKEIAEKVKSAFSFMERLRDEAARADMLLNRLDQATLAKAFRGELVPQDPNEEPASVFIAISRTERMEPQKVDRPTGSRKKSIPRTPREKSTMTKNRRDEDVSGKPYLAELLKQGSGPTNVEELFNRAQLSLTDFYKQLTFEVDAGYIRDDMNRLEAA